MPNMPPSNIYRNKLITAYIFAPAVMTVDCYNTDTFTHGTVTTGRMTCLNTP